MANDDPDFEAADAVTGQRQQLLIDHANALICCEPTTLVGAVALMRYVASLARGLRRGEGGDQAAKNRPLSLNALGLNWHTATRWERRAQKARSTSPRPKQIRFQDNAGIR